MYTDIRQIIREELQELLNKDLLSSGKQKSQLISIVEKYEDGRPKWIRYSTPAGHNITRLLTYKTTNEEFSFEIYKVSGHSPSITENREITFSEAFESLEEAINYFNEVKTKYPLSQIVLKKNTVLEIMVYQ